MGMGFAACRMTGCELIDPVVLPLIHGVILHLSDDSLNCEFSQALREIHLPRISAKGRRFSRAAPVADR